MQLVINRNGSIRCLYGEEMDLSALGQPAITRGSYVEPTKDGRWMADLSPTGGPCLGPFVSRSQALNAERLWLEENWLVPDR